MHVASMIAFPHSLRPLFSPPPSLPSLPSPPPLPLPQANLLGSELLDMAASHLNVKEKEYFGLFTDVDG